MITKTKNKLKKTWKRVLKIISGPEMVILPGNISFSLILSIFPAIMILGYIISKFNISTESFLNLISLNLPKSIYDLIIKFLSGEPNMAWLTLLIGLYFSSDGTKSIIVAANILYKTEEKNALKMRAKSLILVILLMLLFAFTMFVLGFGSTILRTIINKLGENYNFIYQIFTILKWPISFFLIYFFVKILYTICPSVSIKSSSVNKGALFTTIGWMLSTFIYSIYVSNFARYDIFYGSLASIIVLMIWVHILSNILVIGIGINAEHFLNEKK